ncbi:MAG TPA: BrxA family protein [Methylomirabilota bacterium]|nr:BrxA family protein [Methylomirabilota bacterium]
MKDLDQTHLHTRYTTRLQKGGALLDSMRALTLRWGDSTGNEHLGNNSIGLPSRRRVRDVVGRAFMPRLVNSNPPDLWKLLAVLERSGVDRSVIVPIHYYAAAASEPLMWDFVIEELSQIAGTSREVTTDDALRFLRARPIELFDGREWTSTVATKVARGLLAALRDYGILAGARDKRIATPYLPIASFALIARVRHEIGYRGESAIHDEVWKLYFLSSAAIERFFAEAASSHLLTYETAGPVVRIEYPACALEDYAEYVARRTTAAA